MERWTQTIFGNGCLMLKYIGLFKSFFKASLISELEYRFNITVRLFTDILWYAAQLSVFEVIFLHTKQLNGWALEETRIFMGVLFVTDCLYMLFFSENLDRLGERVRRGDLDLLLMKPVNSQWMLSCQKVSVAYLGNLVISSGWLIFALSRVSIDPRQIFYLLPMIPIGLILVYSIRFMTSSTALYLTRADAVTYIWYQVYRLGTRPDTIYPTALRYAVLSVLPIAFLASVPTQVVLGRTSPLILVYGALLATLFLFASHFVWSHGLKRYSSASS